MSSPTSIHFPETLPFPIKIVSFAASPGDSVKEESRLLSYAFLHIPRGNTRGRGEMRYGTWDATFVGELKEWNVKVGDLVTSEQARDHPALHIIEPCKHGIIFGGLCALCGMDMENFDYTGRPESSRATIQMTHSASGPTVSMEEAQRFERETAEHLLNSRRLSLIVDLDQTIVHATVDPTVGDWIAEGEAWEERNARREARRNGIRDIDSDSSDESDDDDEEDEVNPNWEALKDVKKFRLALDTFGAPRHRWKDRSRDKSIQNDGCLYYIKPRPGWQEFLSSVSKKYEMHVYTMGTREYAEEVCAAIDPDGVLFGGRILSRDESGSLTQKSLRRLFPCDTSMVVIIDDRADVWEWSPNLIKVVPYDFFVGIGDINSTFLPKLNPLGPSTVSLEAPPESPSNPPATVPSPPSSTAVSLSDPESDEITPDDELIEEESAAKSEMIEQNALALEAQLEERPLAKKQELLESDDEEEETSAEKSELEEELSPNGTVTDNVANHVKVKHHKKALLKNDDQELIRVGKLLDEVYRQFFAAYDNRMQSSGTIVRRGPVVQQQVSYDVKLIIPSIRMETFKNVHILFSGVIPTSPKVEHETTDIWRMAQAFGATCHKELSSSVTHVVAATRGTQKVDKARAHDGIFVVWLQWFTDSIARWKRQDERFYMLDNTTASFAPLDVAASSPSDPNAISTDSDAEELDGDGDDEETPETLLDANAASESPGELIGTPAEMIDLDENVELDFGSVDWQDVNDEVEAAMMESDSEDEDENSGRNSNVSEDDGMSASSSLTHRKRVRSLTPSDYANLPDSSQSPLAKRRKLVTDRLGQSRLKEAISANELTLSDDPYESKRTTPSNSGSPAQIDVDNENASDEDEENEDGENEDEDEDDEGDGDEESEDEEGEKGEGNENEEDEDSEEGEEIDDDFLAREMEEELG